jgi:phytoene dehydrogenase-like protein
VDYDAIVIGSGLGGLTAGALYASDGKRVLVLERNNQLGGAASVFQRGKLTVEASLHEMDGLDADDGKMWILDKLGVTESVDFLPVPEVYAARHPLLDEDFVMPHGQERILEASIARFPNDEKAIRKFFGTLFNLRHKATQITRTKTMLSFLLRNAFGLLAPFRYWPFIRHDRTALGPFLHSCFGDDDVLKFAMTANIGYYTDDPSNFSLIYYAVAQGSYLTGGGHYIKGGSRSLVDHLAGVIEGAGGTAATGRSVNRILVENGRAAGVIHAGSRNGSDEQEARAPVLFGNAAPELLGQMLPAEHQDEFLEPYRNYEIGPSLWVIYLGLDRNPSEFGATHYSTFIYPPWLESYDRVPESVTLLAEPPGSKLPGYVFLNYDLVDAGTGDEQTHMASLTGFDRLDNWSGLDKQAYRQRKDAWMNALLADLELQYPGISSHIVYKEMATSRTINRFLNTPGGAVYGFAQHPMCAGRHRPVSKTKVPGLLLSSAFSAPGGGFTGAILSGERAYWTARKMKR